jgi:hypothetical protein
MQISRESGIDEYTAKLADKRLLTGSWSDQDVALHFEEDIVFHILLPEPTKLRWCVDTGFPDGAPTDQHAATEPIEMDWGTSVNGDYIGIGQFDPHAIIQARVGAQLRMLFYNGLEVFVYFKGFPYLSFAGYVSCVETDRPFIYVYEEQVWWDEGTHRTTER